MVRTINQSDTDTIKSIVGFSIDNIDFPNSAIYIDERNEIKAMVLTQKEVLVNAFPKKSFPNTRQCRSAFTWYKTENNHKIIFLYKTDRNGYAIGETFSFLLNKAGQRGGDWWWIDKNALPNSEKEFNKIKMLLCPIKNTSIYYAF